MPRIHDILHAAAVQSPDEPAFRFHSDGDIETVDWSYRQTLAAVDIFVGRLVSSVKPGDRVVLALDPGLAFVAALFALFELGVTAVPTFPPKGDKARRRFESTCRHARPTCVVAEPDTAALMQAPGSDPSFENPRWIVADSREFLTLALDAEPLPRRPADPPGVPALALLQYTSGSTGEPKGVMLSHANLLSNAMTLDHVISRLGVKAGISWLPPYHDMGLMGAILQSVVSRFTLHLMVPGHFLQRPLRWLNAISHHRVALAVAPNFALDYCAEDISPDEASGLDLSSLKLLFCGSEPVRSGTVERFARKFEPCGFQRQALYPCYGMAEATLFVSGRVDTQCPPVSRPCSARQLAAGRLSAPVDAEERRIDLVSCGQPAAGHQVLVVAPDTRAVLPEGQVGELWVTGPSVAMGYFHDPGLSESTFHATLAGGPSTATCLRTGDLGAIVGGELYVTGRLKEVIILRGQNLYPSDLEQTVLKQHAGFRAHGVAAFSADIEDEEHLFIVAELSRAARLSADALKRLGDAVRSALVREHGVAPARIFFVRPSTLPLTTSGKIRRTACAAALLAGEFEQRPYVPVPDDVPVAPAVSLAGAGHD